MNRTFKRLFLAASVSAMSYAATFYWYYNSQSDFQFQTDAGVEVARLVAATNEVNKRPLRRLVWKNLQEGDALFNGEAIKTTSESEARIQFVGTDSFLNIEPNSLIVLEKNNDEISLDLLEGGLFVRSQNKGQDQKANKPATSLTLKTDQGKVDLSKADASLSKSASDQSVNVQVLKGQANVEVNGRKTTLEKGKSGKMDGQNLQVKEVSIEVVSPQPFETVYINPENPKPVLIRFKPFQKQSTVYLEIGKNRQRLQRIDNAKTRDLSGKLQAPLKAGAFFYKLVAENKKGVRIAESPMSRLEVDVLSPPTLLSPLADTTIQTQAFPHEVNFQWSGAENFDGVILQVAKDQRFRQIIIQKRLRNSNIWSAPVKQKGSYFWRVVGYLDKKPVATRPSEFKVFKKTPVPRPQLLRPEHLATLKKNEIDGKGINFQWQATQGVLGYILEIQLTPKSGSTKKKQVKIRDNKYTLKNPPIGDYSWTVTAVSQDRRKSPPSDSYAFQVKSPLQIKKLQWLAVRQPDIFFYVGEKPEALLKWEKGPEQAAQYRYKVASSPAQLSQINGQLTRQPQIQVQPENSGRYHIQVEALDANGQTVARTSVRTIQLRPQPLLAAPRLITDDSGRLQATRTGSVDVNWSKVNGAQGYVVELKSQGNGNTKTYKFGRESANIDSLLPGEYDITVRSVDKYGRRGPASEAKPLQVPEKSAIRAPTVNSIEVQ